MQQVSQVLQLTTGINKSNPVEQLATVREVDQLLIDLDDLVNQEFKPWYARSFYRLGAEEVLKLASQARADGRHPAKLFSFLIKKELV